MLKAFLISLLSISSLVAYEDVEQIADSLEHVEMMSNPTASEIDKAKALVKLALIDIEELEDIYEGIRKAKAALDLDPKNKDAQDILSKYYKEAYPDPTFTQRVQKANISIYTSLEVHHDENVSRTPDNQINASDTSDHASVFTFVGSKKFGKAKEYKAEALIYDKSYADLDAYDVSVYGLKLYRQGHKKGGQTVTATLGYQHIVANSHSLLNQFSATYGWAQKFSGFKTGLTLGYSHKFYTEESKKSSDADAFSLVMDTSFYQWKDRGILPSLKLGVLTEDADSAFSTFTDVYLQGAVNYSPKEWNRKAINGSIKYLAKSSDALTNYNRTTAKLSYSHPFYKRYTAKGYVSHEISDSTDATQDSDKTIFGLVISVGI